MTNEEKTHGWIDWLMPDNDAHCHECGHPLEGIQSGSRLHFFDERANVALCGMKKGDPNARPATYGSDHCGVCIRILLERAPAMFMKKGTGGFRLKKVAA